jgi:hypothetical protein
VHFYITSKILFLWFNKDMKFNERMNSESLSAKQENLSLIDFARVLFGPFSVGFVVAGYEKGSHQKFLMMKGSGTVYDDAFEPCRNPFFEWLGCGEEKAPGQETEVAKVPVYSVHQSEGVADLDQAIIRFSEASHAFLMFGYCGDHKVFKSFAIDPLQADAVMYLQSMAFELWGRRGEIQQ